VFHGQGLIHGFVLACLLLFSPVAARAEEAGRRFISINLCTDQLLLDLARPEQILGLSPFARDAQRSWAAKRAETLPIVSGTAEEILMLRPSLVLAGRFTKRTTRAFIRARGIPIEEFDTVRTVAQSREQVLRMARLVGNESKGLARAAELDAALGRLRAAGHAQGLRVLPLARRGWSSGQESIFADLLRTAGLVHAGAAGRAGGFLSLEAIMQAWPDALLLARADGTPEDQGTAFLEHPALTALFPPERRLFLPESLTICGGPMLVEAIARLSDAIMRLTPRDAARR
jgi:iron complex transport system substrate-binding protein